MGALLKAFGERTKAKVAAAVNLVGYGEGKDGIPEEMTFIAWCDDLKSRGMKIDGKPFSLDNRAALVPIYEAIPTTKEEARDRIIVVQKATQLGLTVWEVLAMIYMALKFGPVTIGMFLPDQSTAAFKSEHRFMRIVRSVPELLRKLIYRPDGEGKEERIGEGNILTRVMGESIFLFLWTTGKVTTESRPMDIVGLDEVQEMELAHIDKVLARMGDSDIGFALMLSTANMPDQDINYWFQQGTQEIWHTECPHCQALSDLSDPAGIFPAKSILYQDGEYHWACPECGGVIEDPQRGRYIPTGKKDAETYLRLKAARKKQEGDDEWEREEDDGIRDDAAGKNIISFLIPRTVSPKITPRKMMAGWGRAKTGDQKKSFYNRTLARPYIDADQLPVTMAHCLACVEEGMRAGVTWKTKARDTYMGIDQMGGFNAVIIKERLPDGRQATIHVEAVFDLDPFERCAALMDAFGVAMCVVEQLPNVNDARKFANRFRGRVFLAGYADLRDDAMQWGDTLTRSDQKTAEDDRSRYTVTLNQYKCMQTSLFRIKNRFCLFPDPDALEQDVLDNGATKRMPILRDWVFKHFTKTALVVEQDEETRKPKAKVMKVGLDPHYSYANMLCDVAWARNHGTGMVWFPDAKPKEKDVVDMVTRIPGMPAAVAAKMIEAPAEGERCGVCRSFNPDTGYCEERGFKTRPATPGCEVFLKRE